MIRAHFDDQSILSRKRLMENCLYMVAFISSCSPSQPSLNKQNVKDSVLVISLAAIMSAIVVYPYLYMSVGCQAHLDTEGITYLLYLQNQHTKNRFSQSINCVRLCMYRRLMFIVDHILAQVYYFDFFVKFYRIHFHSCDFRVSINYLSDLYTSPPTALSAKSVVRSHTLPEYFKAHSACPY